MECSSATGRALFVICLFCVGLLSAVGTEAVVDFRRAYCDQGHRFPPSEDQSFLDMLDKLLEDSRTGFSGVEVTAIDKDGMFEGKAGCLWHNCQIYDGECYRCHSTRDAQTCIETLIRDMKLSLQERNGYGGGFCPRTTKFATGEKSVAVDDASTTFQVCGVQYRYLGNLLRHWSTF